jgi:hypothetical protein
MVIVGTVRAVQVTSRFGVVDCACRAHRQNRSFWRYDVTKGVDVYCGAARSTPTSIRAAAQAARQSLPEVPTWYLSVSHVRRARRTLAAEKDMHPLQSDAELARIG